MCLLAPQIDAFVQRCKDLQEVCEGQTQFARRSAGGVTADLPDFGGARGAEVASSLLSIQANFEKHISQLRALSYDILDVKASRWPPPTSIMELSFPSDEIIFHSL